MMDTTNILFFYFSKFHIDGNCDGGDILFYVATKHESNCFIVQEY